MHTITYTHTHAHSITHERNYARALTHTYALAYQDQKLAGTRMHAHVHANAYAHAHSRTSERKEQGREGGSVDISGMQREKKNKLVEYLGRASPPSCRLSERP